MKRTPIYLTIFLPTYGLLWLLISLITIAQVPYYNASSQFFDIAGEWVNSSDKIDRIQGLIISKTIVNTYRAQPRYWVKGKAMTLKQVPLKISEQELAYITSIGSADSKCMIMPIVVDGEQRLRVYNMLAGPSGEWMDLAIDELVRNDGDRARANAQIQTFDVESEMAGYWVNEWTENQYIPHFQLVSENGKLTKARLYRNINGKERNIGEYDITKQDDNDYSQILESYNNDLQISMRFRPIRIQGQTTGIDLIVEEVYDDGSPEQVYRQFFVRDPDAAKKAVGTEIIRGIEGEWINVRSRGATPKILIHRGVATFFISCDNSPTNDGLCKLGHKELVPMDDAMVGTVLKSIVTVRTISIDTHLDINSYNGEFEEPVIIAVTTEVEDLQGVPIAASGHTEIFKRKGSYIPPEAFGITDANQQNTTKKPNHFLIDD